MREANVSSWPNSVGCFRPGRPFPVFGEPKKTGGRAQQAIEYFKALYQVETLVKADLPYCLRYRVTARLNKVCRI